MRLFLDMLLRPVLCGILFGYRVAEMGRHKDGKVVPWSKAQHDRPAFEKYKKAR
jgi:hypothetical protein